MDIKKAIIPAAGLGTRFLPLTKSVPKEMLPLLQKPAIQYIIEEGLKSDISQFLMITSKNKQALENYFDSAPELEMTLKGLDKEKLLSGIAKILRLAHFSYIRQSEPLGLGHAISLARYSIGKEYFGVFLPDDIITGPDPALKQLIDRARQEKASVIAVQEVPYDCVSSYGIVSVKKQITPNLFRVDTLVEKPKPKDAPSNLAIVGRYILSHKIFESLESMSTYESDEIQLTDGIRYMINNNEKVFAYKIQGIRYDIGTPIGLIKATIGMALTHPQYGPEVSKFLAGFDSTDSFLYNQSKNLTPFK